MRVDPERIVGVHAEGDLQRVEELEGTFELVALGSRCRTMGAQP